MWSRLPYHRTAYQGACRGRLALYPQTLYCGPMPRATHVFGLTPWGRYFIDAMERLADTGRLQRGRSYAGNGSVDKLVIEGSTVRAKVRGRYRPWYSVTISFRPAGEKAAEAIRQAFSKDALLAERIARGEMPDNALDAIRKAGAELVPARWSDMQRSCDCPDDGDPCKHMAAVYYILAREIDRDPFTLWRLRGLDVGQAITQRRREAIPDPLDIPARKRRDIPSPAEASSDERSRPLPNLSSFIVSLLPPARGLCPFDLVQRTAEFYHEAVRRMPAVLAQGARRYAAGAASDNAWLYGPLGLEIKEAEVSVRGPGGAVLSPLEAARELPAECPLGATSDFRFLRGLFDTLESIVEAGAYGPDVRVGKAGMSVVWKPARFSPEVDAVLSSFEKRFPKAWLSERAGGNPRRAIEAVCQAYLREYATAVGYSPPLSREAAHPVSLAMFRGMTVSCDTPGERSLPAALDAWSAVLDGLGTGGRFELSLSRAEEGVSLPRRGSQVYALKAWHVPEGGRRVAIHKASLRDDARSTLAFAAILGNYLPALMDLGRAPQVLLSEDELAGFVLDAAPVLGHMGVSVVLPKEFRAIARPRKVVRARAARSVGSGMSLADAFSFDWKVAIGDMAVSPAEFQKLLAKGRRLVRFKDQWVRVDPAEAAAILGSVAGGTAPGLLDAVRASLGGWLQDDGSLSGALNLGRGAGSSDRRPVPAGLKAELRPYQERGYRWLMANLERGLGCVLADDMGLGKTVQAIAAILALNEAGKLARGALVVAPASLITNWERELDRFAPCLSVHVRYGSGRKTRKRHDVTLTSYDTYVRDTSSGQERAWDLLVLDEAHAIKNPASRRALAVKKSAAAVRLALTGTPVENNLAELWSLFEAILPGFLGGLPEFTRSFRVPIERDGDGKAADSLRALTAPFILRRLKTDKAIAASLPEKLSVNEYAVLEPGQAALYKALAERGLASLESGDRENRTGRILAMMTALKQVSNHPRNYDQDSPADPALSGKARLLLAILDAATDAGERILVFSQYVTMLEILAHAVRTELGLEPFVLHGGLGRAARDEAVDSFQKGTGPAVFLISLRAGGVGLNLTAATRVIHYDLWFNPAVESQATDRAYRIGQGKTVFVHRLITRGTLDERIDRLIQSKRGLSELSVKAGERWLGDLSNDELRELVSLRS